MRKYITAVLLVISFMVNSQNCKNSVSGKVTDLHDGSILSGATLVVLETSQTTLSDIDGSYQLNNLCQGQNYC